MFTKFTRQAYWSRLPFPSSGDLPDPGIEPTSPALMGKFFTAEPPLLTLRDNLPLKNLVSLVYRIRWESPLLPFHRAKIRMNVKKKKCLQGVLKDGHEDGWGASWFLSVCNCPSLWWAMESFTELFDLIRNESFKACVKRVMAPLNQCLGVINGRIREKRLMLSVLDRNLCE